MLVSGKANPLIGSGAYISVGHSGFSTGAGVPKWVFSGSACGVVGGAAGELGAGGGGAAGGAWWAGGASWLGGGAATGV